MTKRSNPKNIKISLPCLPGQSQLLKADSFLVAFVAGLGSGKTTGAIYKAIQLGFLNAPCCGYFVQPTYTIVRDTGIKEFEKVLTELGIPYKINITNFVIRVADSFDILLRSGEDPTKIVGTNAAWGIIDEPGIQSEEVGKNVLARIRDPRAKLHQIVLTGTPEGFNWFYEWTNKPNCTVIRAKTTDNTHLPPHYVDSLKEKYSEEEYKAYINGEFVQFEGGWFKIKSEVTTPIKVEGLLKYWKLPEQVSDQLLIGVDTSGGLGKDSTAIAVIDKRDKSLVASWKNDKATVDQGADIVEKLVKEYSRNFKFQYTPVPELTQASTPLPLVEMNGIGLPMWQEIVKRGITAAQVKTTEGTRYAGLLWVKKLVEAGILFGPKELEEETERLIVEEGKFKGPKDLSMAIGFCMNHIAKSPYLPPKTPKEKVFRMNY
jgi:hypothetical protein